jgi:hypothetical protein
MAMITCAAPLHIEKFGVPESLAALKTYHYFVDWLIKLLADWRLNGT